MYRFTEGFSYHSTEGRLRVRLSAKLTLSRSVSPSLEVGTITISLQGTRWRLGELQRQQSNPVGGATAQAAEGRAEGCIVYGARTVCRPGPEQGLAFPTVALRREPC